MVQIEIVNTREEHADAAAAMQRACFPTLPEEDYFTPEHYRSHVRVFPEGQFVALAYTEHGIRLAAASTSMRTNFDPPPAHYIPFIGHNWLTTHEPEGMWLYGIDMSVHPDFRRMGIAKRLYEERQTLARRLRLRGELVAGLLPGYSDHRHMAVEAYVHGVIAGELTDPTLTPQLRSGLQFVRLLHDYVTDPRSDNTATLLMRENPDYQGRPMIYHLIARADWEQVRSGTHYSAPSLANEGFIHFSALEQVAGSANRYYTKRQDMLLLEIDPAKVSTSLVYESPRNPDRAHERFPHLYAPLNLNAVVRVLPYLPDSSGVFSQPNV